MIFLAHLILAFCVTLEKRFISEIEAQLKKVPIGNGESLSCTQLCKKKKKCQVAVEIGTRQSSEQQVVWSGKRAKQRHFASARSKQRTSFSSGRHELPEFFSFLTDINQQIWNPFREMTVKQFTSDEALIIMRDIKRGNHYFAGRSD